MKKLLLLLLLIIGISSIKSQDRMSQDVHKFLTYNAVKLFYEKYPSIANTNTEFLNWLGGNNVNWESWGDPLFNVDFPYMIGSMYVGAFREDQEDVIDNICGGFAAPGYVTLSHFWSADGSNGDNSPIPFNVTENAYKKIKKLWFGNYSEGITIGHRYSQSSHWTIKVKFGPNSDGNLATAYNHVRTGNISDLNYLIVTKDKGYYDYCESNNFSNINMGFYDYWHNKGWSDNDIRNKAKIIIFETLGRICHLLGDMAVPAHTHNSLHIDGDVYESNLSTFYNSSPDRITWQSTNVFDKGIVNVNALNTPLKGLAYLVNQSADRMPSHTYNPWWYGDEIIDGNDNWQDNAYPGGDFGFFYNNLNPYYASIIDIPLNANVDMDICKKIHKYTFPIAIRSISGFIDYFFKNTTYTIPEPQIYNIYQDPYCINQGTVGVIKCNLIQGLDPFDYEWTWIDLNPNNHPNKTFQGYYNTCRVHWHNPNNSTSNPREEYHGWRLKVEVKKKGGSVIASTIFEPNFTPYVPPPHGCPMVVVTNQDTNHIFDNNLLNKSQLPENQGQFITDKYILKTKPGIFDNKISLSIVETSIDSSVINSIKLYAVTHPIGTKLGILSDNTIVMYDSASVIDNKSASLYDPENNYTDITNNILFNIGNKDNSNTTGDSLYHIYADYYTNTITNPGIITYMDRGIGNPINPVVKDNYSGNLFVNTPSGTSQFPFMRRENLDDVIIPVDPSSEVSSVDNIHIAWDKSFKIKYAAVASLLYSGFNITEWYLTSAFHTSDGDVLQNLLYLDSGYTYVSPNAYLNLEFSPSPAQGSSTSIKDYIIEINGQVIYLGSNKMKSMKVKNPEQNTVPYKYSLSQNYPNPFNPVTKINFSIPKQGFVTLKVYDMLGREIRSLVNETKQPGNYSVDFNGANLSSGVYFYRLESNGFTSIKRMVLIK